MVFELSEFTAHNWPLPAGVGDADALAIVERGEQMIATKLSAAKANLAYAMRIATKAEVAEACAQLVAAYPQAKETTPAAEFGSLMLDDVFSLQPPKIALHVALQRVRREVKFFPSIAEVYRAVAWEVKRFGYYQASLEAFPRRVASMRAELTARIQNPSPGPEAA